MINKEQLRSNVLSHLCDRMARVSANFPVGKMNTRTAMSHLSAVRTCMNSDDLGKRGIHVRAFSKRLDTTLRTIRAMQDEDAKRQAVLSLLMGVELAVMVNEELEGGAE